MVDGLPGDIVALALPLDVDKIEQAGLITSDWRARLPNQAVVAESVVAIVTRPGNPKGIRGWDDLTRCAPMRQRELHACVHAQPEPVHACMHATPPLMCPDVCAFLSCMQSGSPLRSFLEAAG